ncbi:MAG: hypothetical protein U9N46_10440 [Euryarchaeota archaeon]|nr:hypothetical protein [Euryarchaeota archaeon]
MATKNEWRSLRFCVTFKLRYQVLVRIATNTIRRIKKHSNKIGDIIRSLPAGSIVLADPEYDVEENYRVADESPIELQVKQRKGAARKSRRKAARSRFERKKYSRRKPGRPTVWEYRVQKEQVLL